jgi:hypothetical protein
MITLPGSQAPAWEPKLGGSASIFPEAEPPKYHFQVLPGTDRKTR